MLHISPHALVTQNVVTECEPRPFSMDFDCPRKERGLICGRHGEELDWSEEKDKFSGN